MDMYMLFAKTFHKRIVQIAELVSSEIQVLKNDLLCNLTMVEP